MEILKNKIAEIIKANYTDVSKVGSGEESFKAVGAMSGAVNVTPASGIQQSYKTEVAYAGEYGPVHFGELVRTVDSATGQYVFFRELPGEGSISFQSTHLATKTQKDYEYTRVTVNLEYLAGYADVAMQMMQDLPFLETSISHQLMVDFIKAQDTQYNSILTAAIGATASAETTNAEKILEFISLVEAAGHEVNGIVLHPTDFKALMQDLPANAFYSYAYHPTTGQLMFGDVPIYKGTWVTAGNVWVGDWTKLEIAATDGVGIEFSYENANNFIQNAVTVKIERREGLAILQPTAFIRGTLV